MAKYYKVFMILFLFSVGMVNAQNFLVEPGFEAGPKEGANWDYSIDGLWTTSSDDNAAWPKFVGAGDEGEPVAPSKGTGGVRFEFSPPSGSSGTEWGTNLEQRIGLASDVDWLDGVFEFSFDVYYHGQVSQWILDSNPDLTGAAAGELVAKVRIDDEENSEEVFLLNQTMKVDSGAWTRLTFDGLQLDWKDSVTIMIRLFKPNNAAGTKFFFDNIYFGKEGGYLTTSIKASSSSNREKLVYPNPAKNLLFVKSSADVQRMAIRNMEGKLVFESAVNVSSVDISHFSPGIYLVALQSKDGVFNQKLVIE